MTVSLALVREELAPPFSEEALALEFAKRHASALRYVAAWNKWLVWDGTCWRVDDKREVFSLARALCREAANAINKKTESKRIASAKTRAAVVSLAGEDRRLAATADQWDADPWLLNTPGGVVDLHTGRMRAHRTDDYMTKVTAVAPDASIPTPLWSAFLVKITGDDKDYQEFLMRVFGYGLTAVTIEHAMFFLHGGGSNGKTTLLNTVANIMGDYHCAAPIETFTESSTDRHPTELAMLRGARVVTATETEENRYWAEAKIKKLTGGDSIRARFMKQDFFEYTPQFKLAIAGNKKPSLRGVDEAIRRRFNMLPFTVTIPEAERDRDLLEKLEGEWPGIMAQLIAGCLDWQVQGLSQPTVVTEATGEYFQDQNLTERWIADCCERVATAEERISELFRSWGCWAEDNGEKTGTSKQLSERLVDAGFQRCRMSHGGNRGIAGLKIASTGFGIAGDRAR